MNRPVKTEKGLVLIYAFTPETYVAAPITATVGEVHAWWLARSKIDLSSSEEWVRAMVDQVPDQPDPDSIILEVTAEGGYERRLSSIAKLHEAVGMLFPCILYSVVGEPPESAIRRKRAADRGLQEEDYGA